MPTWVKPGIVGGLVGAALIMIIAFSAGWIVTAGSASQQASVRADKAVSNALAPICVDRFQAQPASQRREDLTALEEADSWKEADFVIEQGWMEGLASEGDREDVAEACADRISEISTKEENA